ncbi:unnamed protein product [Alternaria alternata]
MCAAQKIPLSEEWRRLKSLRSHKHRLLNTTKYQKLDKSQPLSGNIGTQNDALLLEDGLRNLMRRNDLDTLFDNGLDDDAQDQALASLTSICLVLENIVATNLWTEPSSESGSKYPRIDRLLQELGGTAWRFYMVSGARGRKLFVTTNPKAVKEQTDSFNTFCTRLTQPEMWDLEGSSTQQVEVERPLGSHDQLQKGIKTLQTLLCWLVNITDSRCSGVHEVLLQLPEWDEPTSCERFREPHLDLYLTSCTSSEWQESHLHELANRNHVDWYPAESFCDEIKDLENRDRLTLATSESDLYVYAKSDEDPYGDTNSAGLTKGKPSRTLKELLERGAFSGPDPWRPWLQRFEQTEKRTLASILVLGSLITLKDAHLIKFWDPDSIYFLSNSDGKYIHDLPYARCSSLPKETTEPSASEKNECETRFGLLARLLMEIECGASLQYLQMNNTGADNFGDYIYDQRLVDLSESKQSYLKAVQMCFRFQLNCAREYKRMSAQGHQGGQAAATRNIIHSIVRKIQKAVDQQIHERRTSDRGLDQRADGFFHCPSVSSQSARLGLSNSSRVFSSTTGIPPVVSEKIIQKKLSISTKMQVRFFEQSDDEETGEVTSSKVLLDSPTTANYCELFGETNAREYPTELCKSARRWISEFKKLRRKKTGLQCEPRIKVAVLDTGVDVTHPDIKGNVCDHRSFTGGDATKDQSGHGTHIAGIVLDLATDVDLYIGQVIDPVKPEDRSPIIEALEHAREKWEVDMISLSFGYRVSSNPDLMQKQIDACHDKGIIVFASASNDAGNKRRTYPGDYDGVLCIHSATGSGNRSLFNPSPVPSKNNFSFVGDCVKSCWPMADPDFEDREPPQKYLSGTSIATPVAVSVAVFMINYIRKHLPEWCWNIEPLSPRGMCKIFEIIAHKRDGYDWVSPEYCFTGDQNLEEEMKAQLKRVLRGYIPQAVLVHR